MQTTTMPMVNGTPELTFCSHLPESVATTSAHDNSCKRVEKGGRRAVTVGLAGTLLAGVTDMGGVASGLFGGKKRESEKNKIEKATQDLTKAYGDAIHYIELTDSTAGANQQKALDQESDGGAASGIGGKGPVYSAKALLKEGEGMNLLGVNPADIVAGRQILKDANGVE